MKISGIVLTYNEQTNIELCLQSISWVDEIVVIDSFSTDRTIEISRKYTNKIYMHPFCGYASQRNFGLTKAVNEWVLFIDADEILENGAEEVIKEINITQREFRGYYFPRKNYVCGKWLKFGGNYPDFQLRLFNRTDVKFEHEVHEKLVIAGKFGYLKIHLIHYPYADLHGYFEDFNRYTTLESNEMIRSGQSIGLVKFYFFPGLRFIYTFIIRLGILDGWAGYLMSFLGAFYMFVKYAKYREQRR